MYSGKLPEHNRQISEYAEAVKLAETPAKHLQVIPGGATEVSKKSEIKIFTYSTACLCQKQDVHKQFSFSFSTDFLHVNIMTRGTLLLHNCFPTKTS